MADFYEQAEILFTNFARRHCLKIEKSSEPTSELQLIVPKQDGLSFDIILGLQNNDEINIGIGDFWSYIFPFDKYASIVSDTLNGFMTGRSRIRETTQFGKVVSRKLEFKSMESWVLIHSQFCRLRLPLFSTRENVVNNTAADLSH